MPRPKTIAPARLSLAQLSSSLFQFKNPRITQNDYQGQILLYLLGLDTQYSVSLSQIKMISTWYSYFP